MYHVHWYTNYIVICLFEFDINSYFIFHVGKKNMHL